MLIVLYNTHMQGSDPANFYDIVLYFCTIVLYFFLLGSGLLLNYCLTSMYMNIFIIINICMSVNKLTYYSPHVVMYVGSVGLVV